MVLKKVMFFNIGVKSEDVDVALTSYNPRARVHFFRIFLNDIFYLLKNK
jgi:hypothetical protein